MIIEPGAFDGLTKLTKLYLGGNSFGDYSTRSDQRPAQLNLLGATGWN